MVIVKYTPYRYATCHISRVEIQMPSTRHLQPNNSLLDAVRMWRP